MRLKSILVALAAACAIASAQAQIVAGPGPQNGGASIGAGASNPTTLPLLTDGQISATFPYLGSFTLPAGFQFGNGAMSVNQESVTIGGTTYPAGTLLYADSRVFDPYDTNGFTSGIGIMQIPTLSGAPSYTGGNGTATSVVAPSRPITAVVAPANYTLTAAPGTGATTATFAAGQVPPGFSQNCGWHVQFTGSNSQDTTVYAWDSGTNTFTFKSALTGSGYSSTVSVFEWLPSFPFGAGPAAGSATCGGNGDNITGTLVYGGKLYITGGTFYDGGCNLQLGWALQTSAATPGSGWGSINTASTYSTEASRQFAAALGIVPSIWQPYLGGPAFGVNGKSLSIISCYVPAGFSFFTFDPANITSGGNAVPLTVEQAYGFESTYEAYKDSLAQRSLSGPFPLAGSASFTSYTLASAPSTGATTATLSTGWSDPVHAGNSGFYTIVFSDGEIRIVHLTKGTTAVPNATAGSCDPTGFVSAAWVMTLNSDGTCATPTLEPLTGSGLTTSVLIAPMGSNYTSDYDGPIGTGFIVPNTRTLVYISFHQYGVHTGTSPTPPCDSGASGSQSLNISPDTSYYRRLQITLYDANNLVAVKNGTQPAWFAAPYDWNTFPGYSSLLDGTGCLATYTSATSFVAYDATNERLYMGFRASVGGSSTIYVYGVNPP